MSEREGCGCRVAALILLALVSFWATAIVVAIYVGRDVLRWN